MLSTVYFIAESDSSTGWVVWILIAGGIWIFKAIANKKKKEEEARKKAQYDDVRDRAEQRLIEDDQSAEYDEYDSYDDDDDDEEYADADSDSEELPGVVYDDSPQLIDALANISTVMVDIPAIDARLEVSDEPDAYAAANAKKRAMADLQGVSAARQAVIYHEIFSLPKGLRENMDPWEAKSNENS